MCYTIIADKPVGADCTDRKTGPRGYSVYTDYAVWADYIGCADCMLCVYALTTGIIRITPTTVSHYTLRKI